MGGSHFQELLNFYGENGSLSTTNLENFLYLLTSRLSSAASVDTGETPVNNSECLSVLALLDEFGLSNVSEVTVHQLELMCPALLTQVIRPPCTYMTPETQTINSQVWGYGFLAVTIINLASLLGLLLIPLTKKSYFPKLLTYFIGLAIGTLFSNAVLQLIPEALGFNPKTDNYVSKAVGIFGGFYLLFFTERVLTLALKADSENCHSHFPSLQTSDVTITSFSNDHVINSDKSEIITNSNHGETIPSDSSEEPKSPTSGPVNEQETCMVLACRWLRGERGSNIKTLAWMITLSDALHNFIDGLAIGASFTVSLLTGFSTSVAIVCEEFPHELGDFVILLSSGMSVRQAAFFNLLSAMSCYLGLVLGIVLGSNFAPNAIFAIAGGMFLYIALADMFPEINEIIATHAKGSREKVIFFLLQNAGLLSGFSIILLITMFAEDISFG